ncbi:hypothetical protein AKJ16_DCAP17014 [Drosera capensis]
MPGQRNVSQDVLIVPPSVQLPLRSKSRPFLRTLCVVSENFNQAGQQFCEDNAGNPGGSACLSLLAQPLPSIGENSRQVSCNLELRLIVFSSIFEFF